ncbi:unnamed protein product [Discula destructiva]
MSRRSRLKAIENALEVATQKSDEEFVHDYLVKESERSASNAWTPTWKHPSTDTPYSLSLSQAEKTSDADLEACFSLVEETSRKDYEASSRGWHPKSKRKEMRDPDLRYILVKDPSTGCVCGYTSFMPTMEDAEAVVYCYEIHMKPEMRGTGLAGLLMGFLDTVASHIGVVEKVMLTVFTCNTRAFSFYRRSGFEVDETSPRPRKLRNGIVKEPDYAIMSKRVERGPSALLPGNAIGDGDLGDSLLRPSKTVKDG